MCEESADDHDAQLVLAARAGDKGAFAHLLTRHRALLVAVCRRALADPVSAEDIVQEASLQALLGLGRLRHPTQFGPWLAGIGLNLCRDWRRRRVREGRSWAALWDREPPGEYAAVGAADPATLAEAAEERAWVRHAVAALPRGQRAAVTLFYLSELSQEETAEALGITPGAVRGRLHKARATLRRHLTREQQEASMSVSSDAAPVEVELLTIRRWANVDPASGTHVVVLEERGGTRRLPLFIGARECQALAQALTRPELPPAPTYALTTALVTAAGSAIIGVILTHVVDDLIYATVMLDHAGELHQVEARPSDALNLALLAHAPIRVAPTIFDAVEAALMAGGRGPEVGKEAPEPGPAEHVAFLDGGWRQWRRTDP